MKIAFWSNARGKSCVTSNLACISVLSVLRHPKKRMIVLENHQNIMNLGSIWRSRKSPESMVSEKTEYRIGSTWENILSNLYNEENREESLMHCMEAIVENRLYYLPIGNTENREMVEYRLSRERGNALSFLEQFGDWIWLDMLAASVESTRRILREADLVVVNLNQNRQTVGHFFRNYGEIQKKAFYLIGNYDGRSEVNREYLKNTYSVKKEHIGVIPHNMAFADALSDGRLLAFMNDIYRCPPTDENYSFICEVRRAERLLFKCLREQKGKGRGYETCEDCDCRSCFDGECVYPFRNGSEGKNGAGRG